MNIPEYKSIKMISLMLALLFMFILLVMNAFKYLPENDLNDKIDTIKTQAEKNLQIDNELAEDGILVDESEIEDSKEQFESVSEDGADLEEQEEGITENEED